MLLERAPLPVPQAVERLAGMQAQLAQAPFVGLWTRLHNFQRDDLARHIHDRSIVKATLMRSTLHLATVDDYLMLRATLQPVMTQASEAIARQRGQEVDVEKVVAASRAYLAEAPRSFAEISTMLTELVPDGDVGAMRYAVRTHLPLIQTPVEGGWCYPGNPKFTLAELWLNRPIPDEEHLETLVFRYLTAFGPANVADIQTWSGLSKLKAAVEPLKAKLRIYHDERKRELLDLPDTPLPGADTPAPLRFLPEFDNLLLAHDRRTRVIADEHRSRVFLPGLRVAATFLLDGFVGGVWKVEKTKRHAVLIVEPFETLTKQNRDALAEEGENLIRFVADEAASFEVRFAES